MRLVSVAEELGAVLAKRKNAPLGNTQRNCPVFESMVGSRI